jgi:hypothetical protein
MTKHRFTLLMAISACIVALAVQMALTPAAKASGKAAGGAFAAATDNASNKVSISPVLVFGVGTVVPAAGSQLTRSKDGVFMTLHTSGLVPGSVYSVWWVFFNNPRECATTPCSAADLMNPAVQGSRVNAAARITGADGAADYGSFIAVGDTTGAFDGPGLLDPKKAEIHLAVRTHGPALMGAMLMAQLTMFNGGCPPNMCANVQISVHQP